MASGAYGGGESRAALVLGGEGVGEVIELGAGVMQWRVIIACDVALGCDPTAFTKSTSIT